MLKLSIFVVLVTYFACIDADIETRIINGGQVAGSNVQFPFAASLQQIQPPATPPVPSRHICGGALITWGHVLTSATCCHDFNPQTNAMTLRVPTQWVIVAGVTSLANVDPQRQRPVQSFVPHPNYIRPPTKLHDIGIVVLANIFSNIDGLAPISAIGNLRPFENMDCVIAGFGANVIPETGNMAPSTLLRFARKYVFNQEVCTIIHTTSPGILNVMSNMFCAASFDITIRSAMYDEGNVLVCNDLAAGVLTHYSTFKSWPEVYTRTANYTAWIREISSANIAAPGIILILAAIFTILSQSVFNN